VTEETMREIKVAITFDLDQLRTYTDEFLAQLWHVCQANPAVFGDRDACTAAECVKFEIARRWLVKAPVELYTHQESHVDTQERIDRRLKERELQESLAGRPDVVAQ
jgi:hypothetical protein